MSITDIIPDIHGQDEKLRAALTNLDWKRRGTSWSHPEPDRQIVFLGDFIDRGERNAAVIRTVRQLMDAGRAKAIMGNHELNAIHYHTIDPETGSPLRQHCQKNNEQHGNFLREFPFGSPRTMEVIDWMKTLPWFLETENFRAVHAAWDQSHIDTLKRETTDGVLSEQQLISAGKKDSKLYKIAEHVLKGPELELPDGRDFVDGGGHRRYHVRIKWWKNDAKTLKDAAISVPKSVKLPTEKLKPKEIPEGYPPDAKPVFFGHYWLTDEPSLQSNNVLCLDYSAGKSGPLVTYKFHSDSSSLSNSKIKRHPLP